MICHICGEGYTDELSGTTCDSCERSVHWNVSCVTYIEVMRNDEKHVHLLCWRCYEQPE